MYEVNIPFLEWFTYKDEEKKNIYSGSLRPDPTKGCLCQTTFNFDMRMVKEEGKEYLEVNYFYIPPWNVNIKRDEITSSRFEATEDGIKKVKTWLKNEFLAGKGKRW